MHIPRPAFQVLCNNMGASVALFFAQVSTFSVLVKVLHHLFKVFLAFAQQLVLRFHVQ